MYDSGRRPMLPRWLVLVSLAFNLFFVGWFAGQYLAAPAAPFPTPMETLVQDLTDSMSQDGRQQLAAAFAANGLRLREMQRTMEESRAEVRRVLAADDFDRDRLAASLAELRRRSDGAMTAIHTILVATSGKLSPADRDRLARWQPRAYQAAPPWAAFGGAPN